MHLLRRIVVAGFTSCSMAAAAHAQTPPETVWLGHMDEVASDATDPTSWSPQVLPDATQRVLLTGGGSFNKVLNLGSSNVTWYQMFPNNNGPTTVNGTGTITLAIPYDANGDSDPLHGDPDSPPGHNSGEWGIFTAGGEQFGGVNVPSVINPNVVTESYIETNGSHSLTFNGNVEALTVQAYAGTHVVFNGDVTLTAAEIPDARFLTGNETNPTITFNGNVALFPLDDSDATGFGVRNNLTINLGPNASLSSNVDSNGWGEINLYNGSKLRLFGDNKLGQSNDVWSRGANNVLTNTLDLNGHSDSVEFLGTAGDATLIVDYGNVFGGNSLHWDATHQTNGEYSIVNFQIASDELELGAPGNGFWFETGDPLGEADVLARIKINGINYAPLNLATTTPYWTVVNPATDRTVEFFNVVVAPPNANFNGVNGVDGTDALIWQRGLGLTGQVNNSKGDADHSGTVNGVDLAIFKAQFGTNPTIGAVPEPSAVAIALVGCCGAGLIRRRRTRRQSFDWQRRWSSRT